MAETSHDLELAEQFDAICDRFERDFRGGKSVRIESVLNEVDESLRPALLRELLALELELLAKSGQAPDSQGYTERFPDHACLVDEAFQTFRSDSFRSDNPAIDKSPATLHGAAASVDTSNVKMPQKTSALAANQSLGRFEIRHELGSGAFGTVYRAYDPQLDREVAIKIPQEKALLSEDDRRRFLREARSAATLEHSNICSVHEVGTIDGRDYIVMEYIDGQPLSKMLEANSPLTEPKVVSLVGKIALVLQEAHEKGIIHRDLKSANIMINRKGEPIVMDFGLARRDTPTEAQISVSGQILGSPAYMSPEQARGESKSVGPQADVYSLGILMYEMLCGRRPFVGNVTEVLGMILHVEPESPSKHRPGLDAKIEAVCLRAISKDPRQRWVSMSEFAAALESLNDQDQLLHARSSTDRAHKSDRSKKSYATYAVIALLIALDAILSLRTPRGKVTVEVADAAQEAVRIIVKRGGEQVEVADAASGWTIRLNEGQYDLELRGGDDDVQLDRDTVTVARGKETRVRVTFKPSRLGTPARPDAVIYPGVVTNDQTGSGKSAQPTADTRSPLDAIDPTKIPAAERFDWRPQELVAVIGEHRQRHWGTVRAMALHPNGKTVVSGGGDCNLKFWDIDSQHEILSVDYPLEGRRTLGLVFSGDGKTLFSSHDDGFRIWDVSDGQAKLRQLVSTRVPGMLAITPDAKTLACMLNDISTVEIWDLSNSVPELVTRLTQVVLGSISPDGRTLAVSHYEDQTARLFDLTVSPPTHRLTLSDPEAKLLLKKKNRPFPPAFLSDGTLVTFHSDRTMRQWDVQGLKAQLLTTITGIEPMNEGSPIVVSANRILAGNGNNDPSFVVDVRDLSQPDFPKQTTLNFETDLGVGDSYLTVRVFSADGTMLVTGHANGAVRFWNVAGSQPKELSPIHPQPVVRDVTRVDGLLLPHVSAIALKSEEGERLWNLGRSIPQDWSIPGDAFQNGAPLAVTSDGKTVATALRGNVTLWDVHGSDLQKLLSFPVDDSRVDSAAFTSDGRTLAIGSADRIKLWSLTEAGPKERASVAGQKETVRYVAFTPDGAMLVSSETHGLRVWNVTESGLTECAKLGLPRLRCQTLSPDGRILVAGCDRRDDTAIHRWELEGGKVTELPVITTPTELRSLAYSPDGKTIAAGELQGGLAIYDVVLGRTLQRWKLPGEVIGLFFAPDGRHLITGNANGTAYVLRLKP